MTHTASPLGDYLRARRDELAPSDVGLVEAGRRRVAGLRREEVADLAGISPQYYLRLEQGRDRQPSEQVIVALARALRIEDTGAAYMRKLVARDGVRHVAREVPPRVEADAQRLLAVCDRQAALIADHNFDIIDLNPVARLFSGGHWQPGGNIIASLFDPWMRERLVDWEDAARRSVAALRFRSDPFDPRLRALVGGLAVRDADFRRIWARHEAQPAYFHPFRSAVDGLGEVDLVIHTFQIPGADGWTLTAICADPASAEAVAAFAYLVESAMSTGSRV